MGIVTVVLGGKNVVVINTATAQLNIKSNKTVVGPNVSATLPGVANVALSGVASIYNRAKVLIETRGSVARHKVRLTVSGIEEGDLVHHGLGTEQIDDVKFFDANNRIIKDMDWQVDGLNNIIVYLPYSDTPVVDSFSGTILVVGG